MNTDLDPILAELRRAGVRLALKGEDLYLSGKIKSLPPETIAALRQHKLQIVDRLRREEEVSAADTRVGPVAAPPFVNLHVHTAEGSPGDALCTADQLAAQAAELGQTALGVTDHGSISAWWKFQSACQQHGIKPILGLEAYLAEGDKSQKEKTVLGKRDNHITLIAENNTGRDNLIRLNNIAQRDGFHYRPRVDLDDLRRHTAGIICLTGCISGLLAQAILAGDVALARQRAGVLAGIFGSGNLFLEIQPNNLPEQAKVNSTLVDIAREMDLPLVATCDAHYATKAQSEAHDLLICVARSQKVSKGQDQRYAPGQFFLRSGDEVAAFFPQHPEALKNTVVIAERCNADLDLGLDLIPSFETPEGVSPEDCLKTLVVNEAVRRGLVDDTYLGRLAHELKTIFKQGFASYFLLVHELVSWAREQGIRMGPGRGSVVGSLVAYLLGITALDPIEHNLLFERFLTSARVSLPDIDLDFLPERRGELIAHLQEQYHVLPILTRNFLHIRGALRDAGRVMGVSLATVNKVVKGIENVITEAEESAGDVFDMLFARQQNEASGGGKWIAAARGLLGTVRGLGKHASGLLLLDKESDVSLIPVLRTRDEIIAAWDMEDVEAVRGLKVDLLGLSTLSVLDKALEDNAVAAAFTETSKWNTVE